MTILRQRRSEALLDLHVQPDGFARLCDDLT